MSNYINFICPSCNSPAIGFYQKMKLAWERKSRFTCTQCGSELSVSDLYRVFVVLPWFGLSIPIVFDFVMFMGSNGLEVAIALGVGFVILGFALIFYWAPLSVKK